MLTQSLRCKQYQNYHPILGILLFLVLFFQPILGALHHVGFKNKGRRGLASYLHIWLGRIIITLGMVNGGLGVYISGNVSDGQIWAYALLAGIVWIIWMICALAGEVRRARKDVPRRHRDDHHLGHHRERSLTPPLEAHTRLAREK